MGKEAPYSAEAQFGISQLFFGSCIANCAHGNAKIEKSPRPPNLLWRLTSWGICTAVKPHIEAVLATTVTVPLYVAREMGDPSGSATVKSKIDLETLE